MSKQKKYFPDISLKETKYIKSIIDIFLDKNNIKNKYLIDIIKNNIVTQQIIYILYELITLNFLILKDETTFMKGGGLETIHIIDVIFYFCFALVTIHKFFVRETEDLEVLEYVVPLLEERDVRFIFDDDDDDDIQHAYVVPQIPSIHVNSYPYNSDDDEYSGDDDEYSGDEDEYSGDEDDYDYHGGDKVSRISFQQILNNLQKDKKVNVDNINNLTKFTKNKELLNKISLIKKVTDSVVLNMTNGLQIKHAYYFKKLVTSIKQIKTEKIKIEKIKTEKIKDVFFLKNIGELIHELSMLYIGYIGVMINSKKGGKTKKVNLRKKLKYSVRRK
jgi:hypothetical protein